MTEIKVHDTYYLVKELNKMDIGGNMKPELADEPSYTIKQTTEILGVNWRTVIRMLEPEDGRLKGKLVDTLRGKVWLISPLSIATLLVRRMDSKSKVYKKNKEAANG